MLREICESILEKHERMPIFTQYALPGHHLVEQGVEPPLGRLRRARLDRDPALFFLLRKIGLEDLVSRAVKEETQKLLQAKGAGESVLMDEGDGELAALFGIDFSAVGEKRIPAGPVIRVKMGLLRATKTKETASCKAREKSSRRLREPDRQMQAKEYSRARKNQTAIQDALQALKTLSGEIQRLESELKSLIR